MSDPLHNAADEKVFAIEETISNLLRIGVTISLVIVVIGLALTFFRDGSDRNLPTRIGETAVFPHTPGEVWNGLRNGDGQSIVVLGLMVLLATPFLRVAISAYAFVRAKDWAFVWITLVVLALLATSLFIGAEHG